MEGTWVINLNVVRVLDLEALFNVVTMVIFLMTLMINIEQDE